MMLDTFIDRVGEDRLKVPEKRGLTFYQILTLASIVEREAVLDDEKAKIAGVYQNRIDRKPQVKTGLLEADPTVIYAVDTNKLDGYSEDWEKYVFWTVPDGGMRDQPLPEALDAYNTYKHRGLPPGPIAAPTVASIDAALKPGHEERPQVLRRDPRGPGRPRLQQDARRARAEARQVRLLGDAHGADRRAAGPRRLRAAAGRRDPPSLDSRPTASTGRRALAPLRERLAAEGVDAYFGVRPEHMRWLTGFTLAEGEDKVAGHSGPVPRRRRRGHASSPTPGTRSRRSARRRTHASTRSATTCPDAWPAAARARRGPPRGGRGDRGLARAVDGASRRRRRTSSSSRPAAGWRTMRAVKTPRRGRAHRRRVRRRGPGARDAAAGDPRRA